ncbi:hypothetical protein PI124_g17436 [Phytophthora idaei]|nr:hypothetical protein PI126_g18049 [Phytophthora idaei]KAG3237569.1 hypothetical protein PI124_g17436 [Phytophthora idaei]
MDMRPCFSDRKAERWTRSYWGGSNVSRKSAFMADMVGKQEASATSLPSAPSFAFPVNLESRKRVRASSVDSCRGDVHVTEPPVQVKATVAFAAVARDIELNDVGLVHGRRGSRHPLTKVGEFTRHERLDGQALLSFRAGGEQRLDDGFAGRRGEAV